MNNNTCAENHGSLKTIFGILPKNQSKSGRHKCCGCAYVRGEALGKKNDEAFNLSEELEQLPKSQAGKQRHRSAKCAFMLGYLKARNVKISI